MPDTYIPRTRTAPDLKWLLNERAAVAGTISRLQSRHQGLSKQLEVAKQRVQSATAAVRAAEEHLQTHQQAIAALDRAIELMHPAVAPDAAGEVKPWAGKYGHRGALTEFIGSVIKSAHPEPMLSKSIRRLVIGKFNLAIETSEEARSLRCSAKSSFYRLRELGQVKAVCIGAAKKPNGWLWVADDLPTFQELAQRAAAARETRRARDEAAHADAPSH